MNIDKKLDLLKQIRQVDAPPFLLTRIWQRLLMPADAEAPVKWKWAFAVTTFVILVFNISILFKTSGNEEKNTGIKEVFTTMQLSSTNELYHE
jgi:hypothetical protein